MKKQFTNSPKGLIRIMAAACFFLVSLTSFAQHPGNGGHGGGHQGGGGPSHGGPGHYHPDCNARFASHLDSIPNGISFNNQNGSGAATYAWDFGDGSTSTSADPSHAYAAAGMYYVCLTVTDTVNGGCTDTWCDSVHAFIPAPHCNARFSNRRDSIDNSVRFGSNFNSSGATYAWDFGDGATSTDEDPTHLFAAAGMYYVCLTVTNSNGGGICSDTHCDSVRVFTPAPRCNAHYFSMRDTIDNGRRFYSNHNSSGASYAWDFGDGATSTDEDPAHLYAAAGTYYVCLTVTNSNAGGTCSDSYCDSVRVFTPAPRCNAHFHAGDDSLANNVNFRSNRNSHGATYAWDFGDGNSSTDEDPSNQYAAAGVYYVCLTVTNSNAGGTCSDTYCDSVDTDNLHHGGHHPFNHHKLASDVNYMSGTEASVSVYPNPMTDVSIIHLENTSGQASLQIIDSNGRVVMNKDVANGDFEISKSDLSEGLYFYSVKDRNVNVAKGKIVVQ